MANNVNMILMRALAAFSEQECENWIRGLRYMVGDTAASSYPLVMERWLRKEFYAIENSRETYEAFNEFASPFSNRFSSPARRVTMKELKSFLSRINCKIPTAKLQEHFNEVDVRQRCEIRFDDFVRLYQSLLIGNTVDVRLIASSGRSNSF